MEDTNDVETPISWVWWSLLCAISASAGNNYHLKTLKGKVIYKPNIYVILLGESGLGKAYPIKIAKTLVQLADNTRVIAGRSSIQAIVKELSTQYTREHKDPITDSRALIVNGELSTAIIQDPDALTLLTDLYDGQDHIAGWTNMLKGDGKEKLKEPYITALFGSSPAHFYDSIPQVNIEGGYIGRNLVVFEEKKSKHLDMFTDDDEVDDGSFPYSKYIEHLELISSKGGRLIPTHDAKQLYNAWRTKWRLNQVPDKTGFINRVPDHTLKVAMCLCLAELDLTLVITEDHIQEAIDRVVQLDYANKKATDGKGIDPMAAQTKMVLDFLLVAPSNERTRKQLLNLGYGNYNSSSLDGIIDTLKEMGWVATERIIAGKNSDLMIKLTGEPLIAYKRYRDNQDRQTVLKVVKV